MLLSAARFISAEKLPQNCDPKNYSEAAAIFEQVDKNYSTDLLADDALFQLAELYESYLNNKEKAMELYKDILLKYKGSIYVVEARKRFRELRGDALN
mgnify:CR=1 FL=1